MEARRSCRKDARSIQGSPWMLLAVGGTALAAVGLIGLVGVLTVLGLGLQAMFLAFFVRHFVFAVSALHAAPRDLGAVEVDSGARPSVSVLVACKDEEKVVEGLVGSLLRLDYPADRLQVVIVNDGSSDFTGELLEGLARAEPLLACVQLPAGRPGGKSAALNAGLKIATGEFIVVFDADHRPRTDVIRRLVRHFADPTVGAVQGRCEIRNGDDSLLARLVSLDYLSGYLINEYGRQSVFRLPAYGGANCAIRASSLRELGGWNIDSVTEDTDVTLRLALSGQRVRYDVTAVDEEEAVVTLTRYWRQRYRWARGHQQVFRDYRRAVWRSPLFSTTEKIEATMFLFLFHVPLLSGLGLLLLGGWASGLAPTVDPFDTFILWTLLFIGPLFELAGALLIARVERRTALLVPFFLPLFFVSIALCTKAWVDAVLGRSYTWAKTARAADPDSVAV